MTTDNQNPAPASPNDSDPTPATANDPGQSDPGDENQDGIRDHDPETLDWRSSPIVVYAVVGHKLASLMLARPPLPVIQVEHHSIFSERRDDGEGPYVRVVIQPDTIAADAAAARVNQTERDYRQVRTVETSLKAQMDRLDVQIEEHARQITGPVERANAVKDEARESEMGDPDPNQAVPDPEKSASYRAAHVQYKEHRAQYAKRHRAACGDVAAKRKAMEEARRNVADSSAPQVFDVPLDEIEVNPT